MCIGMLHLSDIHLRLNRNSILGSVTRIKCAVQGVAHDATDLLLIITGDVAFSGKREEYAIAADFVGAIEGALKTLSNIRFLGTVMIPGNHDCDFEMEGAVRSVLLGSVSSDREGALIVPDDVINQIVKVQDSFFEFEELVSSGSGNVQGRLYWTKEFKAADRKIVVRCFNTAWLSRRKELVGQLYFPIRMVPAENPDADLVLTLFHHPYNWLEPMNARAFKRLVEIGSDVVLTGHEHDGDSYNKTSAGGTNTNYVEGMALQGEVADTGFNYVKIDLAAQTYQVHQFNWTGDMFSAASVASAMFTRNQALLEHHFINNISFKKELQDIGAPLSHAMKAELCLRDLFVYPDLRVTSLDVTPGKKEQVVSSADVPNYIYEKKKVMIAGAVTSGKTSLAKILYEDLQQGKQVVPVLLNSSDFKGTEPSQVIAAVGRAFERQYSSRLTERFNQLDPESKVAIIDDWHRVKFNLKGKSRIAGTLGSLFGRIVLITDDASLLHQIEEVEAFNGFSDFERCEIKQFGYRLRGELIRRWHSLGREVEIDELELTHRIATSEHLLDTLIRKSVVPSFPIYVFSLLQASDSIVGQNVSYGSYGHIYESLLTSRMVRVSRKNLGLKYTYLSLMAHHLFRMNKDALSPADLRNIHDAYKREYIGGSVEQGGLLSELIESQLVSESAEGIRFQ